MTPRECAATLTEEVLERGGMSHRLLQEAFAEHASFDARDRHFITRLVHGTLEQQLFLDDRLRQLSRVPVEKLRPWVRSVLRISLYQLFFLDGVPDRAVCHEAAELVRRRGLGGLTGYVNGVLRSALRRTGWEEETESVRLRMPEPLLTILKNDLGPEAAEAACRAFLEERPLCGRVNLSRIPREEAIRRLEAEGAAARPFGLIPEVQILETGHTAPEALSAVRDGFLQLQDPASALAVAAAAPQPGEKVLDLCAAPGGKSLHAADRMAARRALTGGPAGSVLALDVSPAKVRLLKENIERSQLPGLTAAVSDALVFSPEREEAFDLVIADLPCSGLGVIGRKPEIRGRIGTAEIAQLAQLQRRILENAVRYVRPGGRLLFSTCTLTRAENEENAARIAALPGWREADLAAALPKELHADIRGGRLTLLPGRHGTDGFFISLFRKDSV